jgi:hypothetical protein
VRVAAWWFGKHHAVVVGPWLFIDDVKTITEPTITIPTPTQIT